MYSAAVQQLALQLYMRQAAFEGRVGLNSRDIEQFRQLAINSVAVAQAYFEGAGVVTSEDKGERDGDG